MKKNFWIAMALLSLGVTSCKDDVVFDQANYDEYLRKSFVIENVDPNHQWATVGVANASITVNTGTEDTYQVKIYEQNPIDYKGTLKLLGEGRIADGNTLDMKLSYSLAKAYAYVTLFDSQNYMSVYPAMIKDGLLEVDINNTEAKNAPHRVGITPTWNFSDMPADGDFATSLPDNYVTDANANGGGQGVNVVIQNSYIGYLNLWNAGSNIYFPAGNWTVGGQYVGANSHVYLLPGAHVTFNGDYNLNSSDATMHIAQGATFTANNIQYNFKLYNRGEITAQKMTQYQKGTLINEGTVTIEQNLQIANNQSEVINAGTMTAASMSVEGSGHFQNLGTMTFSGETTVNSNDCSWVNNGTYTTGSFVYTAGSTDVINNCKLIVDENFYIGLGETDKNSFQLNGSASVITKTFDFVGPGFIKMGSNSLFKVTETANMGITTIRNGYGIYGPSTGNDAVFLAKKIARRNGVDNNQGFVANYYGHLSVATDDHFDFGYSDKSKEQQAAGEVGNQPYYYLDAASGAKMTTYNGANVTLSDEGCGAAYAGAPDEEERPEVPQSFRYCFEDNFPDAGDYDFNDVVLTVKPTLNEKTLTVQVSLDAVGATKNIGAAMRLIGVKSEDLESYSVSNGFPSPEGQGLGDYKNIETSETFLKENQAPNNTQNMVVVLFKDAHWAMNPVKTDNGGVWRYFWNTVERNDAYEHKKYTDEPPTATYTFVFKEADKANQMLAENLYDVFIVEPYGGGYWEVHTVQNGFKTAQVVTPIKPDGAAYERAYGNNMPWAIMVSGDFQYPLEWHSIGKNKNGELSGAYKTSGHAFAEWAEDSETATDWYLYPDEEEVFK
ncbi:MAG: LruC domain-containing protein [Prevotella sp.]|nr:LruC domain-containing protein [Prevotella sp.]